MQLNLTGLNVEITDPLREFVNNKFAKLEHYFDRINQVYIVLKVEKVTQIAEATLHVNGGELHATSEAEDMYAAIDGLIDKLARQLTKHKDKLKNTNLHACRVLTGSALRENGAGHRPFCHLRKRLQSPALPVRGVPVRALRLCEHASETMMNNDLTLELSAVLSLDCTRSGVHCQSKSARWKLSASWPLSSSICRTRRF